MIIKVIGKYVRLVGFENPQAGDFGKGGNTALPPEEQEARREENERREERRKKTLIKELVLANEFKYFGTLTIRPERRDNSKLASRIRQFRRETSFKGVIVSEAHKDGALHLHFCGNLDESTLISSGVKQRGKEVFNCSAWRHGFSNVTVIEHHLKTANYIAKYLSKNSVAINKRKVLTSFNLKRAKKVSLFSSSSLTIEEEYKIFKKIGTKLLTPELLSVIIILLKKERKCKENEQNISSSNHRRQSLLRKKQQGTIRYSSAHFGGLRGALSLHVTRGLPKIRILAWQESRRKYLAWF